jgi:hypothetical protein
MEKNMINSWILLRKEGRHVESARMDEKHFYLESIPKIL